MKERIKELARQACITIVPEPFDDASRAWNDTMEKFAELIVKECIQAVDNVGGYNEEFHMNAIKEHFGVTE
jgi:hypothetical protein